MNAVHEIPERGPIPYGQLFGTDGGIAAIYREAVSMTATDPNSVATTFIAVT